MDTICTDDEFQSKTEGYVNWGTLSAAEKRSRRCRLGLSRSGADPPEVAQAGQCSLDRARHAASTSLGFFSWPF